MDNDRIIRSMINKCDIYYDDLLISSEEIIEKYLNYFSSQFGSDKKITSFAFHTGSVCFDIASVAALLLACFTYNLSRNDDLLRSLEIGAMVLYSGERYHWEGIKKGISQSSPEVEYIVLIQDAKGKNGISTSYIPFENNKHKVKPYYGESIVTDGRGIRKSKSNRDEFLAYVLDVPVSDVPSTLNISVVVIADKSSFVDICQQLNISYGGGKTIHLTDIVPISYFTGSGEELQIGKNPAKAEAVIKAVSKVSAARDIILDKRGNKVIGLLATNIESLTSNASDFKDLIRRKSLRFAMVTSVYNAESINLVVDQYEDASIFACTKELLSTVSTEVKSSNKLTRELNKQVRNIVGREMKVISIDGCWTWENYKKIKNAIFAIRQSNWIENEKEDFVLSALALLNLFTSSFFSMDKMEETIKKGRINAAVVSPEARIKEMYEIGQKSISMKEQGLSVTDSLLEMYADLEKTSPKETALCNILSQNKGRKIALIVPKAYYADLFNLYFFNNGENCNVTCYTANRFNTQEQYDLILVSGDVVGKRFDPLQCYASAKIEILLYDCESRLFKYRKRQSVKSERKLNARIKGLKGEEFEEAIAIPEEDSGEDGLDDTIREFANLDEFVESVGMFDIQRLVSTGIAFGTYTGTTEVNYVGTFVTGEQILFSKYYSAVIYDRNAQKVTETSPEKLAPGDVLVFTKRNDYTRNIVDMIFDQLLKNKKLTREVQDAAEKAFYWKEALREYKNNNGLTYRALSKELKKYGSILQEVTIRQWLDEESHIVGPRDEKTMGMIAELIQDNYMLADPKGYFEGCRVVRHYRREILSLIAQAINDKLSNKIPEPGSIFEVVYEHVENLSEIMELENIYELDETAVIGNGLVNRPIMETEVLL